MTLSRGREHRRKPEQPDQRTQGERDRDRILYTTAFRRLAGITQVVAPVERQILHNRLTHTLEVAQIARRLAEHLLYKNSSDEAAKQGARRRADEIGGIDPDVVEAGALAHDLGHPPFGHVAETVLSEMAEEKGLPEGFNGNAQSFRIVTKLSLRREDFEGLNLTRATLNAILKYPCLRATSGQCRDKWGVYESEQEDFEWARQMFDSERAPRSAEAELVDWADDVAYAVHDLEDFYRAGLIPLDRLRELEGHSKEADACFESIWAYSRAQKTNPYSEGDLDQAFRRLVSSHAFTQPYQGKRWQRASLRSMTASLISRYIDGLTLEAHDRADARLHKDPELEIEVVVLKRLTWHYVIHNPSLATQEVGHRQIVADLFNVFAEAVESRQKRVLFPWSYRERLEEVDAGVVQENPLRLVVDYIASMTEQQATDMHRRVTGVSPGSALDPIVI